MGNMAESSVTPRSAGKKVSYSSWVVEMEKLIEQTNPSMDMARWKQHSIYWVPEFIKGWTNSKAYQPQFVSLGPYHHGEPHLLPMEEHKHRAMLHLVKSSGKALWEFVAAINKLQMRLKPPTMSSLMKNGSAREINAMVQHILNTHPFEDGMDSLDELREAGIQFKKSDTKSIHSIDFKNGVLSMPQLELYDNTETALLSLMAFEWLHPDAEDDVASYVSFMDQIIESERDVSLLRSKGILVNLIGSDKMVVETFHTLTKKRRNKWRASFKNTYLSNPWVFFSLVVGFILLLATLLQTVYTVVPFYTEKG
nr:unnamed protein product [Digitaria exilis]